MGARRWVKVGLEVFKGLNICFRHAEFCRGWEGGGEPPSAPEVADVTLLRALYEAHL